MSPVDKIERTGWLAVARVLAKRKMLDKHNLPPPLTGVYLQTPGLPTDFGSVKDRVFSRTTKVPAEVPAMFCPCKAKASFSERGRV